MGRRNELCVLKHYYSTENIVMSWRCNNCFSQGCNHHSTTAAAAAVQLNFKNYCCRNCSGGCNAATTTTTTTDNYYYCWCWWWWCWWAVCRTNPNYNSHCIDVDRYAAAAVKEEEEGRMARTNHKSRHLTICNFRCTGLLLFAGIVANHHRNVGVSAVYFSDPVNYAAAVDIIAIDWDTSLDLNFDFGFKAGGGERIASDLTVGKVVIYCCYLSEDVVPSYFFILESVAATFALSFTTGKITALTTVAAGINLRRYF